MGRRKHRSAPEQEAHNEGYRQGRQGLPKQRPRYQDGRDIAAFDEGYEKGAEEYAWEHAKLI